MKNLKSLFAAAPVLALSAALAYAQDAAAPAAEVVEAVVAAPVPHKGDTTWMLVSTILVILMILPGLALFYAGLVRAKNVLSILMQVLCGFSLIAILWVIYGYSLAFTGPASAEDSAASPSCSSPASGPIQWWRPSPPASSSPSSPSWCSRRPSPASPRP
jgi:Amt family ammonium transporter